jgi:glycosyltransferase involved in cell wall biosynthesis
MKIGIDAKYYYSGGPSLVNVVRNIVNNLIECNAEDEIVFFLSKKDFHLKEDFEIKIDKKKNMSFVFIPVKLNFLTNLLLFPFYFYKKGFDVILFQNYIPMWGRGRTMYVNYVYDFLFLDYPQYFRTIDKFVYQLMIYSVKKSQHVITISQSERRRIIRHTNIQPNRISSVYPGLDANFFERPNDNKEKIKKKYNLPEKFILYVGRLNIRKNVKTLLKSFSIINSNISLVIVGKEDNGGFNFEEEVYKLGIKDKVYKIGHVPDDDLAEIVSGSTIFVFPSYAEGFGLPPLEAMKSGIPTIVSNNTSLPEVCGEAALNFDANDYYDLATKIDFLLSDIEVYQSYKIKGKNKAEEFSWQKSVADISTILKSTKD